ncbi:MAG TPA: preprotein translocase subunit SecE [Anaerolineae bacterium]|nr:preprotein translocase subunit SecE [Anaerolineae bacterium]
MAKLTIPKINLRDNRLVQYFRETWFELKKVSWPSRREGLNLTLMVIVVTTALSLILAVIDFGFEKLIGLLL